MWQFLHPLSRHGSLCVPWRVLLLPDSARNRAWSSGTLVCLQRPIADQDSKDCARSIPTLAAPNDEPLVGGQVLTLSVKDFRDSLAVISGSSTCTSPSEEPWKTGALVPLTKSRMRPLIDLFRRTTSGNPNKLRKLLRKTYLSTKVKYKTKYQYLFIFYVHYV